MILSPFFYGLVGEVGKDNGFSLDSFTCFCCHIVFIGIGLTCGCGFTFFSICFGFQTHFSLDCISTCRGAKLPCLIDIDIDVKCTSLGTLAESFRLLCLALRTHLYSKEYVSLVTYWGFLRHLFPCIFTAWDGWALLEISLGTQIKLWFISFCLFCLGTHLSVRCVDGSYSTEGWVYGGFTLEVDAISGLDAMSP